MSAIDDLVKNINRKTSQARQAQIRFVECLSVDWETKAMLAAGTADGVEYHDVMLGLDGLFIRPAVGSVCLIGIIDGMEVSAFLIAAEHVEFAEVRTDNVVINGGANGGLVKVSELVGRLNALERDLNTLKKVFNTWTVSPNDGGGALKIAAGDWAGDQLELTSREDVENIKIKH